MTHLKPLPRRPLAVESSDFLFSRSRTSGTGASVLPRPFPIRIIRGIGQVDRMPVEANGFELIGEARLAPPLNRFVLYSMIDGKTATGPINRSTWNSR